MLQPFLDVVPEGSCVAIDIEGERFADVRADLPVIPASNQKLLVAAVALDVLGEDHRFHTELRGAQPVDGVITGDVYLVGGGDPLLVTADYVDPLPIPAFNTTSLDVIADALQAAGVTQIVGDVVGDGSRYDDEFVVPSWGPEHVLGAEAGPYDALMVNDGRTFADSTIGFNPNQSAARQFIRLLQARNIAVTGRSRNGAAPADGSVTVLGGVDSAPLSDIVDELLQTSDNNTAELLVKEIGFAVRGEGTRVAGLQEIWNTLAEWQVPLEGVELDDGSGLSRNDRLTCDAIVAVLEHVGVDSELTASLPVAGVSGTLVVEMVGGPADGRLAAKTGTLTGVRALSGFLPTDDGVMTFALVLNGEGVDDPAYYQPLWSRLVTVARRLPDRSRGRRVRPALTRARRGSVGDATFVVGVPCWSGGCHADVSARHRAAARRSPAAARLRAALPAARRRPPGRRRERARVRRHDDRAWQGDRRRRGSLPMSA